MECFTLAGGLAGEEVCVGIFAGAKYAFLNCTLESILRTLANILGKVIWQEGMRNELDSVRMVSGLLFMYGWMYDNVYGNNF